MPDVERAKILALIAAGMIIALLYALGGLSLYLRSRYLQPASPVPGVTSTLAPETTRVRGTKTPTLFPTLTKHPDEASSLVVPAVAARSMTQGRSAHAGATVVLSPRWERGADRSGPL